MSRTETLAQNKLGAPKFLAGCDVVNFEINVIFLIKPFFLHDQNVMTKI